MEEDWELVDLVQDHKSTSDSDYHLLTLHAEPVGPAQASNNPTFQTDTLTHALPPAMITTLPVEMSELQSKYMESQERQEVPLLEVRQADADVHEHSTILGQSPVHVDAFEQTYGEFDDENLDAQQFDLYELSLDTMASDLDTLFLSSTTSLLEEDIPHQMDQETTCMPDSPITRSTMIGLAVLSHALPHVLPLVQILCEASSKAQPKTNSKELGRQHRSSRMPTRLQQCSDQVDASENASATCAMLTSLEIVAFELPSTPCLADQGPINPVPVKLLLKHRCPSKFLSVLKWVLPSAALVMTARLLSGSTRQVQSHLVHGASAIGE